MGNPVQRPRQKPRASTLTQALRRLTLAAAVAALQGCVAIPALGVLGGLGTAAAVGGTAAAVGGTTAAVVGGTTAAVGSTTAVAGGTVAATGGAAAATAGGATSGAQLAPITGYQPAAGSSVGGTQTAAGVQQKAGTGNASRSGAGFQQSAGPGGASQSGPGFQQSAGPGSASQSGPGFRQTAGPGGVSQSGPGYSQSAGPGGAMQSGPGYRQSVGPGGVSQSGPGYSQSVSFLPGSGVLVAGAVIAGIAIVSHEILAVDLSPEGRDEAQKLGLKVEESRRLPNLGIELTRLRAPDSAAVAQLVATLRAKDPSGNYDLNPVYRLAGAPAGCSGVRCYGRSLIGWSDARCKDDDEVRIGMIDSALDTDQPAFEDRSLHTRRFSTSAKPTAAERDHGTAVAALLVGNAASAFPGLLPRADLYAADIFSTDDKGGIETNAARFVAALDWLAGEDVSVVNISIAGPDSRVLHTAIRRLVARGVGVVAAAGNLGPQGLQQFPAAYAEVIAVTAVDRGARLYAQASRGSYVAFAAPGYQIWTAGPEGVGEFRNGTSFAAPFVTAAFAQARLGLADASVEQVAGNLRGHARALSEAGTGAGLIQSLGCSPRRR